MPTDDHVHHSELDDTFDFINTLERDGDALTDHIATPDLAVGWLADRDLVHVGANYARGRSAEVLERIRRARAALREVADSVFERRPPSAGAVAEVNRLLRAREVIFIEPSPDGVRIGHRHEGDPVDIALARIAEPLVAEVARGRPERLRVCANDACRWVFFDGSPTGRRRWCSMASCGNRAKAARHRARQKLAESAPAG